MEYKSGQKVFDRFGAEYIYHEQLRHNDHLVSEIIINQITNYSGDDYEEVEEEGKLITLSELFVDPPVKKLNKEILSLNKALSLMEKEKILLKNDIFDLTKDVKNVKNKYEEEIRKFQNHDVILKALNCELAEYCFSKDGVHKKEHGSLLIDIRSGNISWACNEDNYYFEGKFIEDGEMFFTKEEAELAFIEKINKDENFQILIPYLELEELLKRHNIEQTKIISEYIKNKKKESEERKKSNIDYMEKQLTSLNDKLKKIKGVSCEKENRITI